MGKASSSKKVARAARAGGRAAGVKERNLLFPGVIGAIVVLGVGLIFVARNDYQDSAHDVPPVAHQDHWHAAYGVYVCGEWISTAENFESPAGIHSHGDDVVHIHPFSQAGSGENATLGKFIDDSGLLSLSDSKLEVGEESWEEGEQTCDGEDAELLVAQWEDATSTGDPALIRSNLDDIRFRQNGEAYTIAFVPEGETDDIPKPATAANLAELGAIDQGSEIPQDAEIPEDAILPEGGSEFGEDTGAPPAAEGETPATEPPAEGSEQQAPETEGDATGDGGG